MITEILETIFVALILIMIAYLARHYIFTLTVLRNKQRMEKAPLRNEHAYQPSISILIPAHNEEHVIGTILQRMTELTYPKDKTQVIVIDDASTDGTAEIAERYANQCDYIEVLHRTKENGARGKAPALNAARTLAKGEIIYCFDADYQPLPDIIDQLTKEFADPTVGAVQGRVTVLNEPYNAITRLVALERTGGYRIDQLARDNLGLIPQFGGTVGGVRRSLLEQLGGWDESILAEDTDLTFRIYLAGYKIRYVNKAESYEEAVESWQAYRSQRYRWAKGHMQCAFKHSHKVLRSNKLKLREKVDGLLLLNVYFMPILALLSWIIAVPLFLLGHSSWFNVFWQCVPITAYSFVGNFAPFFEVGIATYLDGRTRTQWIIPLLSFTFLLNIPICVRAFADLIAAKITRKNNNHWAKTCHSGNGNCYIANHDKS